MADKKMHTEQTTWTEDDMGCWHGVCKGCKGEVAKHTPSELKRLKIKPCPVCTDMKRYEEAR
jgi:hypothetical protein